MKSFERKLFQLLHLEVIIGSCHSLKRPNNTRSWAKTALNDYIEKINCVMSNVSVSCCFNKRCIVEKKRGLTKTSVARTGILFGNE